MPKFMLIIKEDEKTIHTKFTNDWNDAESTRQNAECGLGCYVEIYERIESEFGGNYERLS